MISWQLCIPIQVWANNVTHKQVWSNNKTLQQIFNIPCFPINVFYKFCLFHLWHLGDLIMQKVLRNKWVIIKESHIEFKENDIQQHTQICIIMIQMMLIDWEKKCREQQLGDERQLLFFIVIKNQPLTCYGRFSKTNTQFLKNSISSPLNTKCMFWIVLKKTPFHMF